MIEVEAQIAIKRNGVAFLNPTKVALLKEIVLSGSLSAAAKKVGISYQHAWTMISEMNRNAPEPLVIKQRGGKNGGGAEMSEYGLRIMSEYQLINETVVRTISQINVEINI
jgi:molybdate transport system regulatory protein